MKPDKADWKCFERLSKIENEDFPVTEYLSKIIKQLILKNK